MRPPHRTRSPRGFTLIELLVALFIFAVMAGLGWQGIDALDRSRRTSEERVAAQLRLGSALAQWEADLAALHDTRDLPPLTFDGAALRLTRRGEDGVHMVVWTLRDGRWQRWAGPPVARADLLEAQWQQAQQLQGNEAGTLDTLVGIPAWQVYYWRNNAWTNAQSSGDVGEGGGEALPQGLRLVLSLPPQGGGDGGATPTLTRDLPVPTGGRS